MQEKMKKRLEELRDEFETGQRMLTELETKQASLQKTLLRISGAIQVLQDTLEIKEGMAEETKLETAAV